VRIVLDAIPAGSRVVRAILRLEREPPSLRGGDRDALEPLEVVAVGGRKEGPEATGSDPAERRLPLRLRPPRYRDLDATEAVRRAMVELPPEVDRTDAAGPERPSNARAAVFRVERFGGWLPERTRLDVTFRPEGTNGPASLEGPTPPTHLPAVSALRAWHADGQTFLTWTQPGAGADDVALPCQGATAADLREARARAAKGPEIRYRVYRSGAPIASETFSEAELIDEVDGFTAWNDEFHGADPRPETPAFRYVVRDGESPVLPNTGIYVHRTTAEGRAWYAVTTVEAGAWRSGSSPARAWACVRSPPK